MPYFEVTHPPVNLPEREFRDDYVRRPVPAEIIVPEVF
jgi:hypothetical protein